MKQTARRARRREGAGEETETVSVCVHVCVCVCVCVTDRRIWPKAQYDLIAFLISQRSQFYTCLESG